MLGCPTIIAAVALCCGSFVSGCASGSPVALNAAHVQDLHVKGLKRNKELIQSSGRRIIDCFLPEDLDRMNLLKANETAIFLKSWITIYGPGINATSHESVLQAFVFLYKVVVSNYGFPGINSKVIASSDFHGSPVLATSEHTAKGQNQCPFDPLLYTTLIIEVEYIASRQAKWVRCEAPGSRAASASVIAGVFHGLGFPDVHVVSFLTDMVLLLHPVLRVFRTTHFPPDEAALSVSLQIFGPCAIPFTIEKQTLLRLALLTVLEMDINVHVVRVKRVEEGRGSASDQEDYVNVTLMVSVYDEYNVSPEESFFSQAFHRVTVSKESQPPKLNQYLSDAGFLTTKIVVHDVSKVEGGPHDTMFTSFMWWLKVLDEQELKRMAFWRGACITSFLITALLGLCTLAFNGWVWPYSSRFGARRSTFFGLFTSVGAVSGDWLKEWAHMLIHVKDVSVFTDENGQPIKLGKGASSEVGLFIRSCSYTPVSLDSLCKSNGVPSLG
eukprot:jgi/Botrbrau1/6379/Bobra.0098s0036.2